MQLYTNFQEFMYSNNVSTSAAGFAIGAASNIYIQQFMNEIILPSIVNITYVFQESIKKVSPEAYYLLFGFFKLLWITLVWLVSIFMAYFILEYILNRNIIGVSTYLDNDEKRDFQQKQKKAQKESVIHPIANHLDNLLFLK